MLALLQLLLPERATEQRVAVLVNAIGEVLTGHADLCAPRFLQLALPDKVSGLLRHRNSLSSASALLVLVVTSQEVISGVGPFNDSPYLRSSHPHRCANGSVALAFSTHP